MPKLKEPLQPRRENMRILRLPLYNVYFESVLSSGFVDGRVYNDYYKNRCTYVEEGVRYLKPFDAVTFFVGRSSKAKWATVELKDIKCDGGLIEFYCGECIFLCRFT